MKPVSGPSPFWVRVVVFALVLIGGGRLGAELADQLPFGLSSFSRLWVSAWFLRGGTPLEYLYDDTTFALAIEDLAPAGEILTFGLLPPAVTLIGLPWTPIDASTARLGFFAFSLVALVAGLALLGSDRAGGVNRTEWLGVCGIALIAAPVTASLLHGEPTATAFLLLCVTVWALETDRWKFAVVSMAPLGLLSFVAWFLPFAIGIAGRWKAAGVAWLALLLTQSIAVWSLGRNAYAAYLRELSHEMAKPMALSEQTVPGLLSRWGISDPVWNPGAIFDQPSAVWGISILLFALGLTAIVRFGQSSLPNLELEAEAAPSEDRGYSRRVYRSVVPAMLVLWASLFAFPALPKQPLFILYPLWVGLRILELRGVPLSGRITFFALIVLALVPLPMAPAVLRSGFGAIFGYPAVLGGLGLVGWIAIWSRSPETRRPSFDR